MLANATAAQIDKMSEKLAAEKTDELTEFNISFNWQYVTIYT